MRSLCAPRAVKFNESRSNALFPCTEQPWNKQHGTRERTCGVSNYAEHERSGETQSDTAARRPANSQSRAGKLTKRGHDDGDGKAAEWAIILYRSKQNQWTSKRLDATKCRRTEKTMGLASFAPSVFGQTEPFVHSKFELPFMSSSALSWMSQYGSE